MEDTHLTGELLEALTTEELPPPVLSYVTWKHLMALCPECKEAVDERDAPAKSVYLITWLEGRIARGLEEFTQAETKLRQAAEGYGELAIGYDTALVCLDLAETYLAQGKHDEVAELAKKTEYLLSANDLTREATTALLLFQRSASRKLLSAEVIRRVRQRIEEHGLKRGSATPGAP